MVLNAKWGVGQLSLLGAGRNMPVYWAVVWGVLHIGGLVVASLGSGL
jgi:hypothetical protein